MSQNVLAVLNTLTFNMTHQTVKKFKYYWLKAKNDQRCLLAFPFSFRSPQWEMFSLRLMPTFTSILNSACVRVTFVSLLLSASLWRNTKEAAEKEKKWDKTDGLTDRCGCDRPSSCAVIQDQFALLVLYIWSSTCSRLCTRPSRCSAWPLALHHGNFKADCHHIQMSTRSRNLGRTRAGLCSSPCRLQMWMHICVNAEAKARKKNASKSKSNLTVQQPPGG